MLLSTSCRSCFVFSLCWRFLSWCNWITVILAEALWIFGSFELWLFIWVNVVVHLFWKDLFEQVSCLISLTIEKFLVLEKICTVSKNSVLITALLVSLFFLLFVNFVHCVEFTFIRDLLLWKQQILVGHNRMIFLCWRCGLYNLVMFNMLSFGVDLYIVGNLFLFFICQLLILILLRIKSLSACYLLTESYSWDI